MNSSSGFLFACNLFFDVVELLATQFPAVWKLLITSRVVVRPVPLTSVFPVRQPSIQFRVDCVPSGGEFCHQYAH